MSARIHKNQKGRLLTAADGCSAGLEQVDVVLVLEGVDLLGRQTGVGEHAVLRTELVWDHGYTVALGWLTCSMMCSQVPGVCRRTSSS
jgi:hypothetical protein